VISSALVFLVHIITPIVVLNTVARLFGGSTWFQFIPIASLLAGYGVALLYFRAVGMEGAKRRAVISVITGSVLFYGSCLAFVCSIANLPTGW